MFALTGGELALVVILFALTWSAAWLPRVGEWLGERALRRRAGGTREG